MANTKAQKEVGDWIRDHWLREKFRGPFQKLTLPLTAGGDYEFAFVDTKLATVGTISTGRWKTKRGGVGSGKLAKIRADLYFLLLAKGVNRRIVLFTEPDMFQACVAEKERGRIPCDFELFLVENLPSELRQKLEKARAKSEDEVSPI